MSLPDGLAVQTPAPRRHPNAVPNTLPNAGARYTPPVAHPGAAQAPRVLDATTTRSTRELGLTLPAGMRVGPALRALLDRWGAQSGCGRIVGGACARIQYHVMARATDGSRPYVYGAPIVCTGDSTLISAAITIGRRADGSRILHCHGGFVDAHGRQHGGHVILDETLVGGEGLRVRMCLFDGVDFVVSPDTETHFDLLQPVGRS
jgi:hypothetical protein